MAGDWIKMRVDLADDPSVIAVSEDTGLDQDAVIGKLHRLWSWSDRHTEDGNAVGVTYAWVDRYLSVPGFALALENAGWLSHDGTVLTIPNFSRHNGKSGKSRALTAKRAATHKQRSSNAKVTRSALPREEKRRVDTNTPLPPFSDSISQAVRDSVNAWLSTKPKLYKPQALKALATRVEKRVQAHGEQAVITAIERAMSQGYKGWDFDEWFTDKPTPRLPTPEEDAAWKP